LKGNDIKRNPHVALSIATDERPYRAVCAIGKAQLIKKNRDEWLEHISIRYGEREGRQWLMEAVRQEGRVVFKLQPDRILSWDYGEGDDDRQERGESMVTSLS
jgi:hypothetical protein